MTALAALAIGCSGDDDEPTPTATVAASATVTTTATATASRTPTATSSPAPTSSAVATSSPAPTATAGSGAGEATGIPAVDAVIAAVLSGDTSKVAALVQLRSLACAPPAGAGGPPACPSGQPAGTMVDVFPVTTCEGEYRSAAQVAPSLEPLTGAKPALYAVYGMPQQFLPFLPDGQYVAVFSRDATGQARLGAGIIVGGGKVLGIWYGCAAPANQIVPAGTSVILPPRA